jgi:hypothetical protein
MSVFLQLRQLYSNQADFFFDKVIDSPAVKEVNVYVAIGEFATYHKVKSGIQNYSERQISNPQINFSVLLTEVQEADPSLASVSFDSTMLFFKATSVDVNGLESLLASATTKSIGTVGLRRGATGDNASRSAYLMGLSQSARGWVPGSMSSHGAQAVSNIPFYEDEFVIERTFSGVGTIATELIYLKNDPAGARAMLITYSGYSGSVAGKVEYTLTTRP